MRLAGLISTILVSNLLLPGQAEAHWCSNIFAGAARMVVKPEKTSVTVTASGTTLKVYLQNNFPYKLFGVRMRGTASGYTITVSPATQDINPGQQVQYTYSISGPAGSVTVTQMNLEVRFRVGSWRDDADPVVDQSPSQSYLVGASGYDSGDGEQVPSLNAATLADRFPAATLGGGAPYFNRTGIKQLIHWFGYRFCYNTSGNWRCSAQDCPSPCAEGSAWTSLDQFAQNCLRAGVDLGIRKSKLGSNLQPAQAATINAMKGGSAEHRCMAAVVGGLLHNGAPSTTAFQSALSSVSATCKAAGLRAMGQGAASTCTSGQYYERAACAAAEGVRGNDAVVKSVLMANAGDGDSSGDSDSLYYAYMLYLVTGDRYAQGKAPSFYPVVGPQPDASSKPDGVVPWPDFGGPPPDGWVPTEGGVSSDSGVSGDGGGSDDDGGCGCRVGPAPAVPGSLLLMVVGLLLGLRQRD